VYIFGSSCTLNYLLLGDHASL